MNLSETIKGIDSKYGSILKMGNPQKIESISTGSLNLDKALGVGGVPRGRITEVFGPESSGKTTLCYHVIANAQKLKETCAFIDAEHAFDENYAKDLGINTKDLIVSQPNTGEEALETAEKIIGSGEVSVVVIDSVASLVPRAEIEAEMGASVMGSQARMMSQAMRKMSGIISKTNTTVIFTNQLRMKIGIVYGNPETTSGGNALKYFASVRIDIRRKKAIEVNGEIIGNNVHCKIVKNKVAPPFREADFDIIYGEGISKIGEIVDMSVSLKLLDKAGAWYKYKGENVAQGKEGVKGWLKKNPKISEDLENLIRKEGRSIEAEKL